MVNPMNWLLILPYLTFLLNSTPLATMGLSPHEILYSRKLNSSLSLLNPNTSLQDFTLRINTKKAIQLATMDMK